MQQRKEKLLIWQGTQLNNFVRQHFAVRNVAVRQYYQVLNATFSLSKLGHFSVNREYEYSICDVFEAY